MLAIALIIAAIVVGGVIFVSMNDRKSDGGGARGDRSDIKEV